MAQIGLHAYIAISLKRKLPKKKWFFLSFIVGSILPDIDAAFTFLSSIFLPLNKSLNLFHRTFTHNIFIIVIIYLLFLITYEITKKKKYLFIGNGLFLGMSLHLLIDIFFWFEPIHLFWPLPSNKFNLWNNITISQWFTRLILSCEFIFFRLFAWEMVKIIIQAPEKNGHFLKSLNYYMRIQFLFFIACCVYSYWITSNIYFYIFSLCYIPSILMMFYYLYNLRDSINEFIYLSQDKNSIENILPKKTPIKNIQ